MKTVDQIRDQFDDQGYADESIRDLVEGARAVGLEREDLLRYVSHAWDALGGVEEDEQKGDERDIPRPSSLTRANWVLNDLFDRSRGALTALTLVVIAVVLVSMLF